MKTILSILLASLVCLSVLGCKEEKQAYMFKTDDKILNIHFILPEEMNLMEVSEACNRYLLREDFSEGCLHYTKYYSDSEDNEECKVGFEVFRNVSTIYSESPISYVKIEVFAYNECGIKIDPDNIKFDSCREYVDGLIKVLNKEINLQLLSKRAKSVEDSK